jgi:hypothetical protein
MILYSLNIIDFKQAIHGWGERGGIGGNTREHNFSHTKCCGSWHMWGKLCGFIGYNVQYVVFIVAYLILKLQFDIKLSHLFGMQTHHLAYSSIDEFDCSTWTCFNISNIIPKIWDIS